MQECLVVSDVGAGVGGAAKAVMLARESGGVLRRVMHSVLAGTTWAAVGGGCHAGVGPCTSVGNKG
jgi:hypothetical protein